MDHQAQKQEAEFKDIVEILMTMFGEVLSPDVLYAVVENCNGDVNLAADAAMTIAESIESNDIPDQNQNTNNVTNIINVNQNTPDIPPELVSAQNQLIQNAAAINIPLEQVSDQYPGIQNAAAINQVSQSYSLAAATSNTGAMPKKLSKPAVSNLPPKWMPWTDQLKNIATNHNEGNQTLVLMRGVPGSGKTFLAKQIINMCIGAEPINHKTHIFSTDDFFFNRGVYTYNRNQLREAHEWNHRRVDIALRQGLSPVVVDNTNVELWEMEPYVRGGVQNGYIIEVVEPATPWCRNANQLARKNSHNVPIYTIKRMLDNFCHDITGSDLIDSFKITYPLNMVPPVQRKLPPVDNSELITENKSESGPENIPNKSPSETKTKRKLASVRMTSTPGNNINDVNPWINDLDDTKIVSSQIANINANDITSKHMKLKRHVKHILNTAELSTDSDDKKYEFVINQFENLFNERNEIACLRDEQETKDDMYTNMVLKLNDIFVRENIFSYIELNKLLRDAVNMSKDNHGQHTISSDLNDSVDDDKEKYLLGKELADMINSDTPEDLTKNLQSTLQNEDLKQRCKEVEPEVKNEVLEQSKEMERNIENILKLHDEWDRGEAWNDDQEGETTKTVTSNSSESEPLPPRNNSQRSQRKDLLESVSQCQDWSQLTVFMPPWDENKSKNESIDLQLPITTMISASTCIESGDTDLNKIKPGFKVLTGKPIDINFYHIPRKEKIPQIRMLDKGTMTNDVEVSGAYRCKNEEQHFTSFRKMFKKIPRAELRDIFDNCCGNVNWAVEIILDGGASSQLTKYEDLSDSDPEEDSVELCSCLAAYNIIPGTDVENSDSAKKDTVIEKTDDATINSTQKKQKTPPNESTLELKRQIEQNFVIPDNHYSQPLLNIRKKRYGEGDFNSYLQYGENNEDDLIRMIDKYVTDQAAPLNDEPNIATGSGFSPTLGATSFTNQHQQMDYEIPSTSGLVDENYGQDSDCDDDSSYSSGFEEKESMMPIKLDWQLIKQLDQIFGRKDVSYPLHVEPTINIPVTLLNEINAYWIESVMDQMDSHEKLNAKLLKEDEEFARQIQLREEELYARGKQPEVPDFKEIMDLDVAMSIYQREIGEWRNKAPNDLAAKMTRDKLCNLFPELTEDVLTEMLMAHDNNFKATVESLLMSTGRNDLLQEKNGLNKFVLNKELERQQKVLQEQEQALSEVEWPPLRAEEPVDMSTVEIYRNTAEEHLKRRTDNFNRASSYFNRGMTTVASALSGMAHFHTKQYEHYSSLAAACLIQLHASQCPNNSTIDLHFYRVAEAVQTLDLFLDSHITKLKDFAARNQGPRFQKLFFITGRGVHSRGGQPKVKPAVRKRLRARGLSANECNPGLLTARVTADDKLSHQVTP